MKRRHTPLDETRAARIREESELNAEFEAPLAHRVDDLVAEGLSPEDARARARAEFGVPPLRPGAGGTPGMTEAIQKKRGEARDKLRRSLLDAVNKVVCPWGDAQWLALHKAYVKFNQNL